MDIHRPGIRERRLPFALGVVLALAFYAVVSAGVVVVILLQLRSDTLASSQNILTAFAQLSDEQTTRTFQNVEHVVDAVEATLAAAPPAVFASVEQMNASLRVLTADRPFIRVIAVLDGDGRVVFSSDDSAAGMDLSGRAYFQEGADHPAGGLHIGTPVHARITQGWILPATRSLRLLNGTFAGLIVVTINPLFFDQVWTVEKTLKGQATALWSTTGAMVMRSPLVEQAMGNATLNPELMGRLQAGNSQGLFEVTSTVDGERRLVAYRRLTAFPAFVITVTQSVDRALAPWRQIARLSAAAWAITLAILCALAAWLIIEWKARRAEQTRYQTLFDANAYPMAVIDRDAHRFLAVNDAALRLYGWSREETLSMSASRLYLPEDLHRLSAMGPDGGSDRARNIKGHRHLTRNGTIIDVEMQSRPILFGDMRATLVTTQNVTGRIRAEQKRHAGELELRQSQERYRTLFNAAPYAVIVSDRATLRMLAVNDAAATLYGWSRDEMLGMTVDELYRPKDRPSAARRRQGFAPDVTLFFQGLRHRRRDGTKISVEMTVRMIDYLGRSAALTMVTDVSARLRLEQAREVAEDQLRQAQKMEVVGQLTGGIAHDFNNLLTVILANADEVQEEMGLEPRVKARLEQIAGAVLRASELTSQLLAFSRKQALHPLPTDLNELVTTTSKLLRRTLGGQVELVLDLAAGLWTVDIDRAQLETALINLCVNARDALPDGGSLRIQSRNIACDSTAASKAPDTDAQDLVRLSVTDTGTGMPPDVLAKVFEPFFTTKDVGKGSGLGLSMVYGFIKQSGGTIRIDSQVGHGTTVNLYLPRSRGQAEKTPAPTGPALPTGRERILVVEDELQVRASVMRQLASLGYNVQAEADGAAGLAACEAATTPFDLLLTDVVMPGRLNGKALGEEVARRWPATVVAYMSGHSEGAVVSRHAALERLLAKPFRKHELAQFVREALDARATASAGS